jgi:TPR repeat protein
MTTLDMDRLKAMSADEISALLSPGHAERPVVIRLAAEAGLADAQTMLGQMLLDGDGVARDPQKAIGWFGKAAEQGHAMAINMIGRCYDQGWGVDIDKARAAEWFRIAADMGLDWAQYNYATLLALGEGVAEDKPAALALLRQAAAQRNAKAINFVGSFYEDGWAVERDMDVAADHYRQAAEGGDFRGCFNHARMLADAGDIDGALHWLSRVGESATPAFMTKVAAWLAASDTDRLRTEGVAALGSTAPSAGASSSC